MPIGSGDHYQIHRNRYENIIRPAVEGITNGNERMFECVRADLLPKSGSITRDLIERLYRSYAVIADLTDLNANVFYELGVRHALRLRTVLIAHRGTQLPFDVGDLRVTFYEDRVGAEKVAIPRIQELLRSLLSDTPPQDSPVLNAIPNIVEADLAKRDENVVAALVRERDLLRAQLSVSEQTALANQASLEQMRLVIEQLVKGLTPPQRHKAEIEALSQAGPPSATPPTVPGFDLVNTNPKTVLALLPMTSEMDRVFELVRQAASAVGLESVRVQPVPAGTSIIDQVFEGIAQSGLVLADLTGRHPNVMYELSLAESMGKPTILLSRDTEELPLDVRSHRVLSYGLSLTGLQKLRVELGESFNAHLAAAD